MLRENEYTFGGTGLGLPRKKVEMFECTRGHPEGGRVMVCPRGKWEGFGPFGGEDFGPPSGEKREGGRDPVTGVANVEQKKRDLRQKGNFAFLRYSSL